MSELCVTVPSSLKPQPIASSWVDEISLESLCPGEPMVSCPVRWEDPFEELRAWNVLDEDFSVSCNDVSLRVHACTISKQFADVGERLLRDGPEVVVSAWREMLRLGSDAGPIRLVRRTYGYRSDSNLKNVLTLPSLAGLEPADALLFLIVTGKVSRKIPLSLARGLLLARNARGSAPSWVTTPVREIRHLRAPDLTLPVGLAVDDRHRLVLRGTTENLVISEGWRSRTDALFDGYPSLRGSIQRRDYSEGEFEHDGDRLIRLRPGAECAAMIPVVDLEVILTDLRLLLESARTAAIGGPGMLGEHDGTHDAHRAESLAANRIADAIMATYAPWPHPFRARPDTNSAVPMAQTREEVVRLFERIRSAPIAGEAHRIAGHFLGLIDQGKSLLTTWPEKMEGVWGFKIKTGDHKWVRGIIWMEPGVTDDYAEPVQFKYRGGFESNCMLSVGALRCSLSYVDH